MSIRKIIYIPSILSEMTGDTAISFTERLASALNRSDQEHAPTYEAVSKGTVEIGEMSANRLSLVRRDGEGEAEVAEVVDFRYPQVLYERFNRHNALVQALLVISLVASRLLPGLLRRLKGHRSKSFKDRGQIFLGAAILLLVAGYVPILILTTIDLFAVGVSNQVELNLPSFDFLPDWVLGLWGSVQALWVSARPFFQLSVLGFTSLGVVFGIDLKDLWSRAMSYGVPALEYLINGSHRGNLMGRLADVLESLAEEGDEPVEFEIWSYSMGSLIALDALYKEDREPISQRLPWVRRLVTVGTPVAFVNLFFPKYFEDRKVVHGLEEMEWVNVFSDVDLLATEFGQLERGKEALAPIHEYGFDVSSNGLLRLGGFHAHQGYWDRSDAGADHNVIDLVAQKRDLAELWRSEASPSALNPG